MRAWSHLSDRRRLRQAVAVGALAVALIALSASSASAIIVRLPNGKELSYEAVATASSGPHQFDDLNSNVDYSGGPIMASNANYVIAWGSPSSFQAGYVSEIQRFFGDLAASGSLAADGDSVLTQYNDAAGQLAGYGSSFGGVYYDSDPLPGNGCTGSIPPYCITDAQVQTELSSFIAANHLPEDLAHEYFLLTPPDVSTCFSAGAGNGCSDNYDPVACGAGTLACFCAYHSAAATSGSLQFLYANIPDLAGDAGCDPFVTFCPVATCQYPTGPADGVLSAIEHEHAESVTDPEPNNGWTDWGSNQSTGYGTNPLELADKCNNDAFNDPNVNLNPQGPHTDKPYNYTINGDHYLLQMLWSNQGKACMHSFTPDGTVVHASFTQTASSQDNVTFDASASTPSAGAEYVWQLNDGLQQGGTEQQVNTVETSSPTLDWSFPFVTGSPATGYVVALTVMAPDGTSEGAAHTIWAVDSGPNPEFTPPAAYARLPATFDAAGSSDPNPGGGITSYSWDFGDGTTGSGQTAYHTYARTGDYSVTLTVEDNYYAVASVSEHVTVSKPPPGWFAPMTALARQTVHFHITSKAPRGTAYSWKFGDGGSARGSHPTHRYRRPGLYQVTLTVATGQGHRRSVTIPVIVMPSCQVPDVKGDSLARAIRALESAGCRLGAVKHRGRHKVTHQSPAAGTIVALGRKVQLTF